jgi:hypothetical protein
MKSSMEQRQKQRDALRQRVEKPWGRKNRVVSGGSGPRKVFIPA